MLAAVFIAVVRSAVLDIMYLHQLDPGTELGYTERYWISVDSGLLVAAETEKDGEVVYAMTARDVVSPLDETQGIFVLPDGTVLH